MSKPVYIVEFIPEPGSIISTIIKAFVPTGFSHTGIRVGNTYYEVDPTKGHTYNKFDLTDNCCDYLKKNGYRMQFYKLGDLPDDVCMKIEIWWDIRLKTQVPFSALRLITMPIDIARQKIYTLQYKLTGHVTKTFFDILVPNADTCISAVDKSLVAAGIDLRPDLSETQSYPGLLSERIRDNRVYFPC